jgi:hypothetical protein
MAQSEQAYAAGKYPTAAVAFEKMLCASDVMLRESVKRARGSTSRGGRRCAVNNAQ